MPGSPVQTLAQPELTMQARTLWRARCLRPTMTGADDLVGGEDGGGGGRDVGDEDPARSGLPEASMPQ